MNLLPARWRIRRIGFAALALVGSTALALALAELAVGLIGPQASFKKWYEGSLTYLLDDDVDWKLEPRRYPWGQVNDYNFRGAAIGPGRTPGRPRIVVLGGSAAFDLYKRDDQTWAAQLESLLGKKLGRPVEIVNAGTPGYSTWQCRRLLSSKLLRWQPDVVILYELYNDSLTFRHKDVEQIRAGWKLNARANHIAAAAHPGSWFDRSGVLLPHLTDYVRMLTVQAAITQTKRRNDDFWLDPGLSGSVQPEALTFYRANRRAIAQALDSAGHLPLVVVTQASLIRADNSSEEKLRIHYAYRGLSHERLVEAYRQAWQIDHDLAKDCPNAVVIPAHEHVPATLEYFLDEVHLNHTGSELLAKYLAQELMDRSLLPAGKN